jgi:phosphatidylglycerophosphate synthase
VARALLYLPEAASRALAARQIAGRPLTVRALVAAVRAGATTIGIPVSLRDPAVERALERLPAATGAVRWLDPTIGRGPDADSGEPWLLIPAPLVIDPGCLRALLDPAAPAGGAVLANSMAGPAPVILAPAALVARLWPKLAVGEPIGLDLARHLDAARTEPRQAPGLLVVVRDEAGLVEAEQALYRRVGTGWDTGVDRFLHRRCSRWITRVLVRTPATPNLVSLASLAVGSAAIWCFWRSTPASAAWGIAFYALASILDHSDGELARLTYQESRFGAHLDWAIDTIIHAGVVLGMGLTAGGPVALAVGIAAAGGVTASAWFARILPHEIEVGEAVGGALEDMGNRDFFYLLLLAFVLFRWTATGLLLPLALLVALGSQAYWVSCVSRIRRSRAAGARS